MSRSANSDFCVTIDFDKGSPNPSRIFTAMSSIIASFEQFDRDLVKHIDNKIETIMLLEDVETGSLKTWFGNILKGIPDDAIRDFEWKKIVGHYLLKAKYIVLDKTNGIATITDASPIEDIETELSKAAEETGVSKMGSYTPITRQAIISNIDRISKSLSSLSDADKVYYDSEFGRASFNLELSVDLDEMEDLLAGEVLESVTPMILKVKKPDYLGDSMWEFKHGARTISAKITDSEWLRKFQNREFDLRPQDSLICQVRTVCKYDDNYEPLSTTYEIMEVDRINPRSQDTQLKLDEPRN